MLNIIYRNDLFDQHVSIFSLYTHFTIFRRLNLLGNPLSFVVILSYKVCSDAGMLCFLLTRRTRFLLCATFDNILNNENERERGASAIKPVNNKPLAKIRISNRFVASVVGLQSWGSGNFLRHLLAVFFVFYSSITVSSIVLLLIVPWADLRLVWTADHWSGHKVLEGEREKEREMRILEIFLRRTRPLRILSSVPIFRSSIYLYR